MRAWSFCCVLGVLAAGSLLPAWLATAASPKSENIPTKDLEPAARPPEFDDELLPPIHLSIRSDGGKLGQLTLGEVPAKNLMHVQTQIVGMLGGQGLSDDQEGYLIRIEAQSDLKASEFLRVMDSVSRIKQKQQYRELLRSMELAVTRLPQGGGESKTPAIGYAFRFTIKGGN